MLLLLFTGTINVCTLKTIYVHNCLQFLNYLFNINYYITQGVMKVKYTTRKRIGVKIDEIFVQKVFGGKWEGI